MTSLVSASQVVTGQVQSLDSLRAHSLPSDAMIFASATSVTPPNQNLGSYGLVESANALTLTTTGSVPVVTQSPFADLYKEGSLYFNGTVGNYVSATATGLSTTQWNTTGLTVEAWVNYTTFAGAANQSSAQNQPNLLGFGGFSWLFGSNVSGNASFYYWTNGSTPVTYLATTPLSTNTWNHIAFTCTSSGTGYMFINGVQSQILTNTNGTITGPASTVSITGTPTLPSAVGSTLYLNQNIGGTAGVSGYVADARIVTGAALYTAAFTVPSTPLSPAATGVTQALIRAGANAPYVSNGALTFDRGLKQFAQFGPRTFNIVTQGFTAIWRGQFTGTAAGFEPIFQAGSTTAGYSNGTIALIRSGTSQVFYLALWPSNSATAIGTSPVSTSLSQNTTYVIAARYNPATQLADIWVNGVPGTPVTITTASLVGDRIVTAYAGQAVYAGSYTSATMNTLAVYNRALSNVEILNAYSALTTNTVNAPIEIGDVNGVTAFAVTSDGRVNVTKLGQTSNVVPWPPAAMTGYVTSINGGTYVASASSEYSTHNAWMVFDKGTTNFWQVLNATYTANTPYSGTYATVDVNGTSYAGEWLQVQLPSPVTLSSYSMTNYNNSNTPSAWWILGSRDGVNWFLVDFQKNQPATTAYAVGTYSPPSSQAFSYFRFVVNVCANGAQPAIAEWTLYGTADTAQPLTVSQPVTLSYGAQTASLTGISGDKFVPQDFSSSGLNIPAYVVSNTATVANTVAFSSFGPFAGEGSLYFGYPPTTTLNQCGAYVNFAASTAPNFTPVGTPFTIEGWVYIQGSSSDNNYYIFLNRGSPNTGAGTAYDMTSFALNGTFYMSLGAGVSPNSANASGFVYNAWNHVSGCWNGTNTIYASVNGTVGSQVISSGTPTFNAAYSFLVGAQGGAYNMRGYIACARVVRGAALYTTSFTPPTGPLQPIQGVTQAGLPYGTVLLLRNAPAPGRVLTSKFGGANSGGVNGAPLTLAFPPAAMTGYSSVLNSGYGQGTYVASASTESSTYYAWTAFDKSASTFWGSSYSYTTNAPYGGTVRTVDVNGTSYAGEWLQIQKPSSIVLSNYSLLTQSGAVNTPGAWYVLGSRDGTNWFLVDQRSGATWAAGVYNTYQVQSSQAFNYFRIVVNIVSTNTGLCIAEWTLNGTIEGPAVSADGRLGLGVTNPTQALEVAGSAVVAGTLSAGNPLMFRNRIINGDFRVDQRGSASSVPTGGYGPDRWQLSSSSSGQSFKRYTLLSASDDVMMKLGYKFGAQINRGTGGLVDFIQYIELGNCSDMFSQPMMLSFWGRSSTAADFTMYMAFSATGTSSMTFNSGTGYSLTTNWQYITIPVPVPPIYSTSTDPSAYGILLTLRAGSGTPNSSIQYYTGVQLEKGSVATPFEVRPYATELALCQRYYQKTYNQDNYAGTVTVSGAVTVNYQNTDQAGGVRFIQSMRANPGITIYSTNGTLNKISNSAGGADIATGISGYTAAQNGIVYISGFGGSLTSGTGYRYHFLADAEL